MTVERIREFRRVVQRDASSRVVPTAHGLGHLLDAYGDVYDRNFLWLEAPRADAATLAAEADEVLANRHHRRLVVLDAPVGLTGDLADLGYGLSTHLVLRHDREPDRRVDTSAIAEVELEDVLPARRVATLREPWGDEEIAVHLAAAAAVVRAAVPTRYFAVLAGGNVAGWCELYTRDGVAQIENVEVLAEHQGHGLGRALVQHAIDEARRVADVVFLEALADDWPRELYAKLGFVAIDRLDLYTRLPSPLTRLRLRTPRLELRLPTVDELRRLDTVLAASIAEKELVAFLDGEPVGTQPLHADAEPRVGTALEGRGLEAEMRAAAGALAAGLRGEAFRSPVPVEVDGLAHARTELVR